MKFFFTSSKNNYHHGNEERTDFWEKVKPTLIPQTKINVLTKLNDLV